MNLNILGFGVMGRQITSLCVLMGMNVCLWNRSHSREQHELYQKQLKRDRRLFKEHCIGDGKFTFVSDLSQLEERLTIEVLVEDIQVKRDVVSGLGFDFERIPLVTNSSSYSPLEIHSGAIGIHFFNPICTLKFVELSADEAQITSEVKTFLNSLEGFDFEIVKTAKNRGYVGNYMLFNEISNALKLIEKHGYSSKTIDAVQAHMGRAVSLFDIIDRVGVDVTKKILENLGETDDSVEASPFLGMAIAKGIYGKKNNTSIREIIDSGEHTTFPRVSDNAYLSRHT